MKNILVTSAGRRVSLVKIFKSTLKKFNKQGKVFTVDINPFLSSACQISNGYFKVSRATDKNYLDTIMNICIKNNISIVVPTIDTELSILAKEKDAFYRKGILLAVSSKEICDTFYLKSSTGNFFSKNGFKVPRSISKFQNCEYPIFAKLNNSSSSIGAMKVDNLETAKALAKKRNYIFQEFIDGQEYTIDVFIDRYGKIISVVPRERIEVRSGEVSKARTVKDEAIINEVKRLCKILKGAYGTLTIQLFKTDKGIYFIEINPRFGGGYPLSYFAGANFARYLIEDYLGKKICYNKEWKDNLIMLRYDSEVIIDGNRI